MEKDSDKPQNLPVAHAVQSLCKEPSAGSAAEYLKATVRRKGQWLANAVMFGTIAANAKLLKKSKGEFSEWLKSVCRSANVSLRTGYNYIYLAGNLLHKIQISRGDEPLGCSVAQYVEHSSKPLKTILCDEKETFEMLSYVFGSLPEPTLNDCLRQSNAQAIDAERESASETAAKTLGKRDLKGLSGDAGSGQSAQMLLWEDWTNNLAEFDKLTKHKDIVRLPLEKLVLIERSLEDRLDEIKNLIKHCGE